MNYRSFGKTDLKAEQSTRDQREFEERKRRANRFQFLTNENRTLAQAAIQFVLQLNGISAVLPRAVNCDELNENVGSLSAGPLTEDELKKIYSLAN